MRTYAEATSACISFDRKMKLPNDMDDNDVLRTFLSHNDVADVWIDVQIEPTFWHFDPGMC